MRKTVKGLGAQNPHTRGGRRAHGPMVAKDWSQKLNSKQKTIARNSRSVRSTDVSYGLFSVGTDLTVKI